MTTWLRDRAAVAVLSFDVDGEAPILANDPAYGEHLGVMSHQGYGPTVGVPRLLKLLGEYGITATFFVPGVTAELHPEAVYAIANAGHEIGHHSYAHRSPVDLDASAERRDFEQGLEALARLGITPLGHRAAFWEPSYRTPRLVAEYGLEYDSSLMDDDKPYRIDTASAEIVELPVHWSLDDWEQYAFLPRPAIGNTIASPDCVAAMWKADLDAMRRHGCLFMLTCHPFLSGRPARVEALRLVIEHGLACGDVAFMAASELARTARQDPDIPVRPEPVPVELEPQAPEISGSR